MTEFLRKDFASKGGEILYPGFSGSLVSPRVFDVTASGACGISLKAAGPWEFAARSKAAWGTYTQNEYRTVWYFLFLLLQLCRRRDKRIVCGGFATSASKSYRR